MPRPAFHVALSGRSGSGKTAVASYLVEHHGYVRVGTGTLCRRLCVDLFGYESKTLMNTITDALRAVQDDVWLAAALRHTEADGPLVVDSMRFLPDYSGLRSAGYELWRIDAPRELRWARLAQRGQEFDPMQDELASAEVELDACSFHQVIRNTLGLPELWDGIDAALDEAVHRREDVHRE